MSATRGRATLYELLGVPQAAGVPQIQAAYRQAMNALDAQRSTLPATTFDERMQLLRMAYSTLTDPASRTSYDARLQAAARSTPAVPAGAALALVPQADAAGAEIRADALGLRADALGLRADAMLARAGLDLPQERRAGVAAGSGVLGGVQNTLRAIGLLVGVGFIAFGIARCANRDSAQRRIDLEQKAAEQGALQDYYQTYGVRPANMAELQSLEAARRRKETEQREADQARRRREQDERRFEDESRRIGREASYRIERQEESARMRADREREREQELKFRAEQLKLESELARNEADRRRLELQRQQVLERLKQP